MEPLIRINTQKVIGRMAELGYTKTSLAAALGIDRSTLAKYLKNPDVMPYGIMAKMALLLCGDSVAETRRVFFAELNLPMNVCE